MTENKNAVIDLGTNTFNLLIGSMNQGQIKVHYAEELPVMLGEGGGLSTGIISDKAIKRAKEVLKYFGDLIQEYEVKETVAAGTSALRDAQNGNLITESAMRFLGTKPDIISGDREATLIYKGVQLSANWPDESLLIMDIGGGSTEFIIGKGDEILWKKSYNLGAARLKEQFKPENPISDETLAAINKLLEESFHELKLALLQFEVKQFVGSAGSFETLRDVIENDLLMQVKEHSNQVKIVSGAAFKLFCGLMFRSIPSDRKQLSGIPDYRIEMIVSATVLMQFVFKMGQFSNVMVSPYALKEGLFAEFIY